MLVQLWKEANEKPEAFMDHAGVLRDARTGEPVVGRDDEDDDEMCEWSVFWVVRDRADGMRSEWFWILRRWSARGCSSG
jgi:hypothetical protein